MNIVIVVGVPGCGKSSILQEVKQQFPSIAIVNYGDMMLEEVGISRDQLRKLPMEKQREIGLKAAEKIAKQEEGLLIVDTHALIRTKAGFIEGLPRPVVDALLPNAFVCIESHPSLILQRRKGDDSRKRDEESEEQIAHHQELTRDFVIRTSAKRSALLCLLQNDSPSIHANCQPLLSLIENLYEK